MIVNYLLFLSAVAVIVLSGFVIFNLLVREGLDADLLVKYGVYFMLGLGSISTQLFLYSLCSVRFSFLLVSIPWFVLTVYLYLSPHRRALIPSHTKESIEPRSQYKRWIEILLLLIIMSQVIYAFLYAPLVPIRGWDSFQTWFFKARVFFVDSAVKPDIFLSSTTNYSVHAGYPLLIPLSATWVYVVLGKVNEQVVRLIYPLQFVSLLVIFHYIVQTATNRRNAILFSTLLSLTPMIMSHTAGFPNVIYGLAVADAVGYADLTLSIYFLGAGGFLYLYALTPKRSYFVLTALFLGMGAWTKDEGLVFAIIGSMLVLTHLLIRHRPLWVQALSFTGITAAITLPWLIYKVAFGIPGEYDANINMEQTSTNIERLPVTLSYLKSHLFQRVSIFNFTWYAYVLSVVANWRGFLQKPLVYINCLLLVQFTAYIFVYVISFINIDIHLATSLNRVIMHMVPLAMLITAVNLQRFIRNEVDDVGVN